MSRRLAVAVPVFQEAAGITPTLEALAAQDDADFDVWFVDNGSTDGSAEVIRAFAEAHGSRAVAGDRRAAEGHGRRRRHRDAARRSRRRRTAGPHGCRLSAARRLDRVGASALTPQEEGGLGLRLVGGELLARRDEGVGWPTRALLRGAVHLAEAFGRIRSRQSRPRLPRPVPDGRGLQRGDHRRAVCGRRRVPPHQDRGPARGPRARERGAPDHRATTRGAATWWSTARAAACRRGGCAARCSGTRTTRTSPNWWISGDRRDSPRSATRPSCVRRIRWRSRWSPPSADPCSACRGSAWS